MNIYLTNHANVRQTNFCNAHGQTLYKSETPGYASRLVPNQKTTISKIIPNKNPNDICVSSYFHIHSSLNLLGNQATDSRTWPP
jgi:hypothetical protein